MREERDPPPVQIARRCPRCRSPRVIAHAELPELAIAHIDCDAFYAAVEKRDRPELVDSPLIVGGGRRGVVTTACYIARSFGVRSAMPMFKAMDLCPDAVVIRPEMAKYAVAGRAVRALMHDVTPLVEPVSIDEAFLDLSGTERLHGGPPARTLAKLALTIEKTVGVSVSIGLSHNKFLAKFASELDKPKGFAVIGRAEARAVLAAKRVGALWGIGPSLEARLQRDGIRTVAELAEIDPLLLARRYGKIGERLANLARGIDDRPVQPDRETKSISAETTFSRDTADVALLEAALWPLVERVSARLKAARLAARGVTLKLKSSDFAQRTRTTRLPAATALAADLWAAARPLIAEAANGGSYRLIGVGAAALVDLDTVNQRPGAEDLLANLVPTAATQPAPAIRVEAAADAVRAKHGADAIRVGRGFKLTAETPRRRRK